MVGRLNTSPLDDTEYGGMIILYGQTAFVHEFAHGRLAHAAIGGMRGGLRSGPPDEPRATPKPSTTTLAGN